MQRHIQLSAVSAFGFATRWSDRRTIGCDESARRARFCIGRADRRAHATPAPCCLRAHGWARPRHGPTVAALTDHSTRSRRLFVATARCELTEGRQPSPPRSAWTIPRTPRAVPPSSASRCHTRAPKRQRRRRTSAARADGHHHVGAGPSRLLSARHARSEGSTIDGVRAVVSLESESAPKRVGSGGQAQEPE